jgi:hypothetical protein
LPPAPAAEPAVERAADRVERLERRVAELEEQLKRLQLELNELTLKERLPHDETAPKSLNPSPKFKLLDPKPE